MSPLGVRSNTPQEDIPLAQQRIFVTLRNTFLILQKLGIDYAKQFKPFNVYRVYANLLFILSNF